MRRMITGKQQEFVDELGEKIIIQDNNIIMSDLPTSDPKIKGALWNDNGTLKISAGE